VKGLHTPPASAICHPLAGPGRDTHSGLQKKSAMGSDQDASENFGSYDTSQLVHKERDDECREVIVQLTPRWRVIVCKDYLQWIIQKRTAEPLHRGVWRSQSYVTSRSSLIRLCASLELLSDPLARARLEALPEQFSGLYKK
jgi:hypothetical protein